VNSNIQPRKTVNMRKDLEMLGILFFTVFVTVQAAIPYKLQNGHGNNLVTGGRDAVVKTVINVPSGGKAVNIDLKLKNTELKTIKSVHDPKKFTVKPGEYTIEISGENLRTLEKKVRLRGACILVAHMRHSTPGSMNVDCKIRKRKRQQNIRKGSRNRNLETRKSNDYSASAQEPVNIQLSWHNFAQMDLRLYGIPKTFQVNGSPGSICLTMDERINKGTDKHQYKCNNGDFKIWADRGDDTPEHYNGTERIVFDVKDDGEAQSMVYAVTVNDAKFTYSRYSSFEFLQNDGTHVDARQGEDANRAVFIGDWRKNNLDPKRSFWLSHCIYVTQGGEIIVKTKNKLMLRLSLRDNYYTDGEDFHKIVSEYCPKID